MVADDTVDACPFPPGAPEKVAWLQRRASEEKPLWTPNDMGRVIDGRPATADDAESWGATEEDFEPLETDTMSSVGSFGGTSQQPQSLKQRMQSLMQSLKDPRMVEEIDREIQRHRDEIDELIVMRKVLLRNQPVAKAKADAGAKATNRNANGTVRERAIALVKANPGQLTVGKVASRLGCASVTIYTLIRDGVLTKDDKGLVGLPDSDE